MRAAALASVLALGAVSLIGCSGGDDDAAPNDAGSVDSSSDDTADGSTAPSTAPDSSSSDESSNTTPATTAATEPPATTPPPTTAPPTVPDVVLEIPGTDPIILLTDASGGGDRPLLSWEPADSAATYYVVVYDDSGDLYWASVTPETQVFVGGATAIPSDNDGPRIADDYSWVVYADDADGLPVGASARLPISP